MDRVRTFIDGFDELLGGGVPKGSVVLVSGAAGTMKTAMTFSILYENGKGGAQAPSITLQRGQGGPTGAVRGGVPRGRDPVPPAVREGGDGRPAAPAVREDAEDEARARLLRPDPGRREVPARPRDLRVTSSGGA